ncbi:MAG: response regulator [Lachnospiraceae bacterium]|nr:response regulator [Lachnospiraceae bacterium]
MLRILIIDDVEVNRFVLKNIIEDMGYQPILAENGIQALKMLKRIVPDLILLDISMPEMDGYEFCGILKQDIRTRNIPIIFISAYDDPEDVVKGFEAGGTDYVTKPFIPEVVKARVGVQIKLLEMNRSLLETNRRLQFSVGEQIKQIEAEKKKVLHALLNVAKKNVYFDELHIERLQYNCKIMAQAVQLSNEFGHLVSDMFIETMELSAPLCELGNAVIHQSILQKTTSLLPEERNYIQTHTDIGLQILEELYEDNDYNDFVEMSRDIVKYHHENWDGSGYPAGIKENNIPFAAQLVSLIAEYCALTEDRTYRKAYSREEALEIIEKDAGVKFNPELVVICKKIARRFH